MTIDTVILAAGKSRRMGTDKALMRIDGEVCIEIHLKKLLPLSDRLIIVLSNNLDAVREAVAGYPGVMTVYNAYHEAGMFSSVQEGFRHVGGARPVLLQMVDQPGVSVEVYQRLVSAWRDSDRIIQPGVVVDGKLRPGHPLVFHPDLIEKVVGLPQDTILRDVVDSEKVRVVEIMDINVMQNLNTPQEINFRM